MQMQRLEPGPVDYVVRCIGGRFTGRFAHINRGSGEIFGTQAGGQEVTMCIEDADLSARHARISFNAGASQYFLGDEGSDDGTWVAVRWRRSVEIQANQEITAGGARLQIAEGPAIPEEEEVAHWLAAYQLKYLVPKLQEHGIRSLDDLRKRSGQLLDLVGDSLHEAEEQSTLTLALNELEKMFPPGQYCRHMLALLLQPSAPGESPREICQVSWSGGVVAFAPGQFCTDAPDGAGTDTTKPAADAEGGDPTLGIVPSTGWSRVEHLKFGFSFGRYYAHWHAPPAESAPRCFVRLAKEQRHWLQPQDVFRVGSLEFQVLRFNIGVYAEQGRRASMEDEDIALQDLAISYWRNTSFFGIYDGHGGRACVDFVRHNLHLQFIEAVTAKGGLDQSAQLFHDLHDTLQSSFLEVDRCFINRARGDPESADSGSAAVVACIIGGFVFCANLGDSRAVLCRDGKAVQLSLDHKPGRIDEHARIAAAGGFVSWGRTNGRLALSRAFGDVDCKSDLKTGGSKPVVIAEPEIRWERLTAQDEFLLLACDGVFDVFSTQEAIDFARARLVAMPPGEQDPSQAVKELVREALDGRGSRDNVTAMLISFKRTLHPKKEP